MKKFNEIDNDEDLDDDALLAQLNDNTDPVKIVLELK